jgi:hypothetical protein
MITLKQYFGAKPHTKQHESNAKALLACVNSLCEYLGVSCPIDPDTGTEISGSKGGAGDGGFRLPTATTGSKLSSHKTAQGVDKYDPNEELDNAITNAPPINGMCVLEYFGLYREHQSKTHGWCHLTTRAPGSGLREFMP